jgi:Planctomycete cytochrome C
MKYTSTIMACGLAILAGPVFAAPDLSRLPAAATQQGVTYAKDIRPLFEASCFRCHGSERQKGDLRLDSLEAIMKGGKDGDVVVPGKSDKSDLVIAVAQIDDDTAMPPKKGPGRGRGPGGGPGGGGPGGGGAGGPGGQGQAQPQGQSAGGGPNFDGAGRGPGGPGGGFGGPGGPRGRGGPPSKPLTAAQVALVRAWIDQGAK